MVEAVTWDAVVGGNLIKTAKESRGEFIIP